MGADASNCLGSGEYLVTVAWQGLGPVSAPPDSVDCGAGEYDGGADSVCVDDLCRRRHDSRPDRQPDGMIMDQQPKSCFAPRPAAAGERGFSLVELMVSMVIGLLILGAMTALFMNTSTGNREMARANGMIENGRLAIELLESDVVHAGYWGGYMPTFDDQTFETVAPVDEPTAIPDPCLPLHYAMDRGASRQPDRRSCQAYDARVVTDDALCEDVIDPVPVPDTDILVVRHAELCTVPGVPLNPLLNNCDEPKTLGKLCCRAAVFSRTPWLRARGRGRRSGHLSADTGRLHRLADAQVVIPHLLRARLRGYCG